VTLLAFIRISTNPRVYETRGTCSSPSPGPARPGSYELQYDYGDAAGVDFAIFSLTKLRELHESGQVAPGSGLLALEGHRVEGVTGGHPFVRCPLKD
jgi:hypothetical protein